MPEPKKTCFVIMPISDIPGYEDGHFGRIYSHLIKPACEKIGLEPIRADEVKRTNYIIIDIIQKIIQSDIVICDLSGRNPNVLYELGIRQAFDLPVVLIKDKQTDRIFDIQGFRTFEYDESLRIDKTHHNINEIANIITDTLSSAPNDINSFTKLLAIKSASISESAPISQDTSMILNSIQDIASRITKIENLSNPFKISTISGPMKIVASIPPALPNGEKVSLGEEVFLGPGGEKLGNWFHNSKDGVILSDETGKHFLIPKDSEMYSKLSTMPF